mmetsp:Transcript_48160/g.114603  ORF Transcript_48160/g.114603 Transcript_48160/m.114603 type:complete len:333 (-) Transcript_48160:695-1693(-)
MRGSRAHTDVSSSVVGTPSTTTHGVNLCGGISDSVSFPARVWRISPSMPSEHASTASRSMPASVKQSKDALRGSVLEAARHFAAGNHLCRPGWSFMRQSSMRFPSHSVGPCWHVICRLVVLNHALPYGTFSRCTYLPSPSMRSERSVRIKDLHPGHMLSTYTSTRTLSIWMVRVCFLCGASSSSSAATSLVAPSSSFSFSASSSAATFSAACSAFSFSSPAFSAVQAAWARFSIRVFAASYSASAPSSAVLALTASCSAWVAAARTRSAPASAASAFSSASSAAFSCASSAAARVFSNSSAATRVFSKLRARRSPSSECTTSSSLPTIFSSF